ncbi:MAG TPA: hypothetical protein VLF18_01665 [Tahibacter sp.]|uniref:hypothetical protein n=1 Tax=Tahibacter sp. TaxID=2056211 RepID=UPI002B614864|nr:hypothetical protein [Tahibacter sp.]HSX58882.1 hypothetical protein [Tahibacter sp.]
MRRLPALIAAALGLACGYGFTRYPTETSTAAPVSVTTSDDAPESTAAQNTSAPRTPRVRASTSGTAHPLLARAAGLPTPPLPPAQKSGVSLLDELRQRAERGDAAAAAEWLERDARCYAMMPFTPDAGATLPTPGFARAARSGRSRLSGVATDVSAAAQIEDDAQRSSALASAQQRLLDECRGYVPQPPQVRYAFGELAARLGTDKDFWKFINDPPFAAGYSRDTEQAIDWARRAPAMVYERAVRGDAEAALALGIAYAIDRPRELDGGGNASRPLVAAIGNDPLQAYRWLNVYLRANPAAQQSPLAQALLNRIGADLSAQQRAEAANWVP